jgi:Flp pilus assembly protein TadG
MEGEVKVRPRNWFGKRARRASVSVEFAILSVPLTALVLGTMELGYALFVQEVLDYAVETAARSVQVGLATGKSGENSAAFIAASVCPNLNGLLDCTQNQLIVGVAPVSAGSNYYTNSNIITMANAASAGGHICTGTGTEMMQLSAWYVGPSFVGMIVPSFTTTYNGSFVHITASSASFVNENFGAGEAGCT